MGRGIFYDRWYLVNCRAVWKICRALPPHVLPAGIIIYLFLSLKIFHRYRRKTREVKKINVPVHQMILSHEWMFKCKPSALKALIFRRAKSESCKAFYWSRLWKWWIQYDIWCWIISTKMYAYTWNDDPSFCQVHLFHSYLMGVSGNWVIMQVI